MSGSHRKARPVRALIARWCRSLEAKAVSGFRRSRDYFLAPRPTGIQPGIYRLWVWPRWAVFPASAFAWLLGFIIAFAPTYDWLYALAMATIAGLAFGLFYGLGQPFSERAFDEERIRRSYFPDEDDRGADRIEREEDQWDGKE